VGSRIFGMEAPICVEILTIKRVDRVPDSFHIFFFYRRHVSFPFPCFANVYEVIRQKKLEQILLCGAILIVKS
jgi:hypothetical protein